MFRLCKETSAWVERMRRELAHDLDSASCSLEDRHDCLPDYRPALAFSTNGIDQHQDPSERLDLWQTSQHGVFCLL